MGTTLCGAAILTKSKALYVREIQFASSPSRGRPFCVSHTHTHTRAQRRFRAVTPDKQTINLPGEKDEDAYNIMHAYIII